MFDLIDKWDLNKNNSNIIYENRFNILDKLEAMVRPEGQAEYFISFTNIENKLGINPNFQSGNTPAGVYGYPLTPDVFNDLVKGALPFAQNRKYIAVGRINLNNKKILEVGSLSSNSTQFKDAYEDILTLTRAISDKSDDNKLSYPERHTQEFKQYAKKYINSIQDVIKKIIDFFDKTIQAKLPEDVSFGHIKIILNKIYDNLEKLLSTSWGNFRQSVDQEYIKEFIYTNDLITESILSQLKSVTRRIDYIPDFDYKIKDTLSSSDWEKFLRSISRKYIDYVIGFYDLIKNISSLIENDDGLDSLFGQNGLIDQIIKNYIDAASLILTNSNFSFDPNKSSVANNNFNFSTFSIVFQLSKRLARLQTKFRTDRSSLSSDTQSAIFWSKILIKLGYGAVIDYGAGLIHDNEKTQILLFPGSYDFLFSINNHDWYKSKDVYSKISQRFSNNRFDTINISNTSLDSTFLTKPPFNSSVISPVIIDNCNFKIKDDIDIKILKISNSSLILTSNCNIKISKFALKSVKLFFYDGAIFDCPYFEYEIDLSQPESIIVRGGDGQNLINQFESNNCFFDLGSKTPTRHDFATPEKKDYIKKFFNRFDNVSNSILIKKYIFSKIFSEDYFAIMAYNQYLLGRDQ